MISKRILEKWRKESLQRTLAVKPPNGEKGGIAFQLNCRVLVMTQELLDQYLLKKEGGS